MHTAKIHVKIKAVGLLSGGLDSTLAAKLVMEQGINVTAVNFTSPFCTCTSCHASSKALGYGTHDGRYMKAFTRGVLMDIATANGEIVSKTAQFQISPIPDLPMDLDQVVTRSDKQVQTVGHHWPLSGPLTVWSLDPIPIGGVFIPI